MNKAFEAMRQNSQLPPQPPPVAPVPKMASTSFNLPLMTIPLYFALALYPHLRAATIATKGDLTLQDTRNPNGSENAAKIKKRLSPREFAAYERAKRCHANHLENGPIFVAAIFAGLLAEKVGEGQVGLNAFAIGWMVVRVLYTVNYLTTETKMWSYLRTVLYNIGLLWAFVVIGRAAFVLGA